MSVKRLRCLNNQHGCQAAKSLYGKRNVNVMLCIRRSAQISGFRSPGRINFMLWSLIFVGSRYGTCLMSPYGVVPTFVRNLWNTEFLVPSATPCTNFVLVDDHRVPVILNHYQCLLV